MYVLDVCWEVFFALSPESWPEVLHQGIIKERKPRLLAILVENVKELGLDVREQIAHLVFALSDQFSLLGDLRWLHHEENCVAGSFLSSEIVRNLKILNVAFRSLGNRLIICSSLLRVLQHGLFDESAELANKRFPERVFLDLLYGFALTAALVRALSATVLIDLWLHIQHLRVYLQCLYRKVFQLSLFWSLGMVYTVGVLEFNVQVLRLGAVDLKVWLEIFCNEGLSGQNPCFWLAICLVHLVNTQ